MKSPGFVSVSALFLLSLIPSLATAQEAGASASGSYRFILEEEDSTKSIEFEARAEGKGLATGQMTFIDQAKIPDVDDDVENPYLYDTPPELYIKAGIDRMEIEKNRAVMSGTVTESSHKTFIGKSVQLVVEDNAGNRELPDRLSWSFCRSRTVGWVPSDAERKEDDGAFLHWWATDAERDDDVGIPSKDLLAGETSCPLYPLWSYIFPDLYKWEGDIVVQP